VFFEQNSNLEPQILIIKVLMAAPGSSIYYYKPSLPNTIVNIPKK